MAFVIVGTITVLKQYEFIVDKLRNHYRPQPVSDDDVKLMNRIDEIFTGSPEYGSRFIRKILRREDGLNVNRKRIVRLMRKMGICAIYPGKNTSAPGKGHGV